MSAVITLLIAIETIQSKKLEAFSFLGYSVGYTLDAVGAAGVGTFSRVTREEDVQQNM